MKTLTLIALDNQMLKENGKKVLTNKPKVCASGAQPE